VCVRQRVSERVQPTADRYALVLSVPGAFLVCGGLPCFLLLSPGFGPSRLVPSLPRPAVGLQLGRGPALVGCRVRVDTMCLAVPHPAAGVAEVGCTVGQGVVVS